MHSYMEQSALIDAISECDFFTQFMHFTGVTPYIFRVVLDYSERHLVFLQSYVNLVGEIFVKKGVIETVSSSVLTCSLYVIVNTRAECSRKSL